MALRPTASRTWPGRDLQPVLLRGGARRPRAPRGDRQPAPPGPGPGTAPVAAPLRGHGRLRAAPGPQRDRGGEVLPAPVARGAASAVPRPDRHAGEELEVLRR